MNDLIEQYYHPPEFWDGYVEGYETAKVDMRKYLEEMEALKTETGTVTTQSER